MQPEEERAVVDDIAVVIPVYMGKAFVRELCARLISSLEPICGRFSIVLVDDRSPDDVWPDIVALGGDDPRVRGIQLSRNFGQHYAITAGIDRARARWYVVMDCDLQDAPEDIPLLYAEALKGFDMVVAARRRKEHGLLKRMASRAFYRLFKLLSGVPLDWSIGNYRIFSNAVAEGFREMREQLRCFPASLSFMGFEVGEIEVVHHSRPSGKSSYTARKLVAFAAETIIAHSHVPLTLTALVGLVISILSLLTGLAIIVRTLAWGSPITGWASLMVGVFTMGGFQLFAAGVIGIYVGKTFDETKRRPLYFVRDLSNF